MFLITSILLIICGVLLLIKAWKTERNNKHYILFCAIFGISGAILIIYGSVIIYYVITGVVELPLM